jgi:integrase
MESNRVRGDGSTYLRGNTYWVAFYQNGKLIRESAKTSDEEQALKYLRRCTRTAAKAEGAGAEYLTPKLRKRPISELVAALKADFELRGKASPQNLSNLRRVDADFGMYRSNALTGEIVDEYIKQREDDGDSKASINRTTQLLKQAYLFAEIPEQMIPRIRKLSEQGNERQGYFSPGEIECVISHLPKYLQPFVRFGWETGMRKHEIASLEWSDVDGDVITLKGENAKNGEPRTVPIEGEIASVIEECRKAREIRRDGKVVSISRLLFHTPDGDPILEFRKTWARACCKAGVGQMVCPKCELAVDEKHHCSKCGAAWRYDELKYSGRIFHDLRRSAVRWMVKAGVSRHIAMSLSGHKTESVFERYNIKDVSDQREALRKKQAYLKTVEEKVAVMAAGK